LSYQAERYRFAFSKLCGLRAHRILNIGAGALHFDCLAALMGFSVEVADACSQESAHATTDCWRTVDLGDRLRTFGITGRFGLDVLRARLDGDPDADCVVMMDVIEHFTASPLIAFGNVAHRIRKGGYVYIALPNVHNIRNKISFMLNRNIFTDVRTVTELPPHVWHHKEYDLTELRWLVSQGFTLLDSGYYTAYIATSPVRTVEHILTRIAPCYSQALWAIGQKSSSSGLSSSPSFGDRITSSR
jgi:2-polyprenyl-3-methyl-5-hydroxy-6-metoxy-1,4-benzoquinol methylase